MFLQTPLGKEFYVIVLHIPRAQRWAGWVHTGTLSRQSAPPLVQEMSPPVAEGLREHPGFLELDL